ncbi:hypothetical protein NQ314_010226 [Rhamnusium bicolor]|uniref:Uncharacterized protein n=1 Tax=Rhamnusium bicolor TaxID=1586634 RepID=A0AAV8XUJ1_9CUCU|nr:hypothetical protein NQ314_010226 [Rhamnusium bicolor]
MKDNKINATLLVGMMGYIIIRRRRTRNRAKWAKTWLLRKELHHMPLVRQLQEDDPDDFKNYLRMDEATFKYFLDLVKKQIN